MKVTDQQIIEAATTSATMAEGARKVGLHLSAFVNRTKKLGVHRPNQSRAGIARPATEMTTRTIPLSEILDGKHPQYQTNMLKRRLLADNILTDQCSICGENSNAHVRILDHVNGINNDHRLQNLRLVCPNCNAALPTHAGRNKTNTSSRLSEEVLICKILEGLNNHQILVDEGMTPNGANYRRLDRLRQIVEVVHRNLPLSWGNR